MTYKGVEFGKVQMVRYGNYVYGDFSIATVTNSNFSTPRKVWNEVAPERYITISGLDRTTLPIGTIIYKNGDSTNDSSGKVVNVNPTATTKPNDFVNYGMTEPYVNKQAYVDNKYVYVKAADRGDSGGSVYRRDAKGLNQFIGIVKEGNPEPVGGGNYRMYVTPIQLAYEAGFRY